MLPDPTLRATDLHYPVGLSLRMEDEEKGWNQACERQSETD